MEARLEYVLVIWERKADSQGCMLGMWDSRPHHQGHLWERYFRRAQKELARLLAMARLYLHHEHLR